MARRQHLTLMIVASVMAFLVLTYWMSSGPTDAYPLKAPEEGAGSWKKGDSKLADLALSETILTGDSIAPKLENATAKFVNRPLSVAGER
jgi:FAD-linked sulfhydryl oxidase